MSNNRKKCLILISFIGLLFIAFFWKSSIRPAISYDKSILIDNQNSFKSVANICMEYYNKSAEVDDIWLFNVDIDNNKLYCYNDKEQCCYPMTKEQKQIFKNVKSVFRLDHLGLANIFVNDNFVTFGTQNGRCSFIYSPFNKKPNFVNSAREDNDNIYVEKITDNWFYACKQS